jgi:GNAT superfamily N-acetyltransferase
VATEKPMNEINIRKASVDDVPVIHDLLIRLEKSLGATGRVKRQADDLRRFGFSGTPCFQALIAWRGSEAVGLALFFPEFSSWKGRPGVFVQDLFVSRALRGEGLGRALMEAVHEYAHQWGASYCKLAVYDDNDAAIAFYEKLGFHVSGNERILMLDGQE